MLVNSKKILEDARLNHYAVPHFNINNLEWTKYILEVANDMNTPIILGVSEGAIRYMGGVNTIVGLVTGLIKDLNIKVDICLHVDHGPSFEVCKMAIEAGFTSVMIDGSKYPLAENIALTKKVVDYANKFNVTVEGEVGCVGGTEDGVASSLLYASLSDCQEFYKETKVDSLAPALGSVHGLYKGEPNLDFKTMKLISDDLKVPLVLHGGTGIPADKIKQAISSGICKININTELQIAWHQAVVAFIKENPNQYDPRKVISSGELAIKQAVKDKIILFSNK
ncbi:MAG: class II fructose-1,6-bisphosphate aldolase [Bacilli bacterium]